MTAVERRRVPQEKTTRSDTNINVRVPHKVRDLIDTAASVVGKTRTEFVLDSAKQQAIDVLLEQRLFSLADDQYEAFLSVLDSPPPPVRELRDLFHEKAPWER